MTIPISYNNLILFLIRQITSTRTWHGVCLEVTITGRLHLWERKRESYSAAILELIRHQADQDEQQRPTKAKDAVVSDDDDEVDVETTGRVMQRRNQAR